MKEEEVDFSDPTDPVGVVESVNLLGLEESDPLPPATSIFPEGAESLAPTSTETAEAGGAAGSAPDQSAQASQVVEGAGPSAPSRPPRTRGNRGGKDKQYQVVRRAYWQGFDQLRAWLELHSRPKSGRRGLNLSRVDFDRRE